MTTTVAALLAHAGAQVGQRERTGNNDILYADYWGITGSAWCYAFVNWCYDTLDARLPYVTMYVPHGVQYSRDVGQSIERGGTPQPGDIVHFTWDMNVWPPTRPGTGDHVGLVESVDGDTITTIEGNVGSPQGVWRLNRSIEQTVVNFWRPTVYSDTGDDEMTQAQLDLILGQIERTRVDVGLHTGGIYTRIGQAEAVTRDVASAQSADIEKMVGGVGSQIGGIVAKVTEVAAAAAADRAITAQQVQQIATVASTVGAIADAAAKDRQEIIQAIEAVGTGGEIDVVGSLKVATDMQLLSLGPKRLAKVLNMALEATASNAPDS